MADKTRFREHCVSHQVIINHFTCKKKKYSNIPESRAVKKKKKTKAKRLVITNKRYENKTHRQIASVKTPESSLLPFGASRKRRFNCIFDVSSVAGTQILGIETLSFGLNRVEKKSLQLKEKWEDFFFKSHYLQVFFYAPRISLSKCETSGSDFPSKKIGFFLAIFKGIFLRF